jgi:hypothetical protein
MVLEAPWQRLLLRQVQGMLFLLSLGLAMRLRVAHRLLAPAQRLL